MEYCIVKRKHYIISLPYYLFTYYLFDNVICGPKAFVLYCQKIKHLILKCNWKRNNIQIFVVVIAYLNFLTIRVDGIVYKQGAKI